MTSRETTNKITNNNSNSELATSPQTKQSRYYHNHQNLINQKRRLNYKTNKTQGNNKLNTQGKTKQTNKPNDVKSIIYKALNKAGNTENKPIISLNDVLTLSLEILRPQREQGVSYVGMKRTYFFALPDIVEYLLFFNQAMFWELEISFKNKLSKHQLKRAMQLLVKSKWIIRRGKNELATYLPNPFLAAQFLTNEDYIYLVEYARLKIDFFELLNLPLINALNQTIIKSEVTYHEYGLGSQKMYIKAFFCGYVTIKLTANNGVIYETQMPVNIHTASKIVGRRDNKPITDAYGFPHCTLPLNWKLFDVQDSREYTRKSKVSRWAKKTNECQYIHFDNSFKIVAYKDKHLYMTFRKAFDSALKSWNNKDCQYVEVSHLDVLSNLFEQRFVNNQRQAKLLDSLKLRYKPIKQ